MDYVGIDPHKKERQICILTEEHELIERRVRTTAPLRVLPPLKPGDLARVTA